MNVRILFLTAMVGCSGAEPAPVPTDPWLPSVVDMGTASVAIESLSEHRAVPLGSAEAVIRSEDGLFRRGPDGGEERIAFESPDVAAAVDWDGALLLQTDSGLVAYAGGPVANPLEGLVDEVTRFLPRPSGLWMETASGLKLWRAGAVLAPTADGAPTMGAALGRVGRLPVVWSSTSEGVVGLRFDGDALTTLESTVLPSPPQGIATGAGHLAVSMGENLALRDRGGVWTVLDFAHPITAVRGNADGPGLWVGLGATSAFFDGNTWRSVDVEIDETTGVDALGRLFALDDDGTKRLSVDYPLAVLGLDSPLLGSTEVQLSPTSPELQPTLALDVEDSDIEIPVVDGVAMVEPEQLPLGANTLVASATYTDHRTEVRVDIEVGADFEITWPEHIEPIFDSYCTPCHTASGGVLELTAEEHWQTYMFEGSTPESAGILERIESDNMPPDTRTLSPSELYLVREWANNGW